jgi:phospholipid/cholesterol/gamma-HCH transport system substrate-binding protein
VTRAVRPAPVPLAFALVVLAASGCGSASKHADSVPAFEPQGFEARFDVVPAGVRAGAPVRIAGVDVGVVRAVERAGPGGALSFMVEPNGLPVFRDARLKLRPRIFKEGAWFVDLEPGAPGAGELPGGARIPASQTAGQVQRIPGLDSRARRALRRYLRELERASR